MLRGELVEEEGREEVQRREGEREEGRVEGEEEEGGREGEGRRLIERVGRRGSFSQREHH